MDTNIFNNYSHLEFDQILSKLQEKCLFSYTKKTIKLLTHYERLEDIFSDYSHQQLFYEHYDLTNNIRSELSFKIKDDIELIEKIKSLKKGSVLEIDDLYNISKIALIFKSFKAIDNNNLIEEDFNSSGRAYQVLLNKYIKIIAKFFNNNEFDPYSYPPLRKIWQDLQRIEGNIRELIKTLLGDERYIDSVQYNSYDLINDHYVLPVRSDRYNRDQGMIISKSNHGLTLYVEPSEIKDLSNLRIQLLAEYDEILLKLERELSDILRENYDQIYYIVSFIFNFDFIFSKLKYGIDFDGCFPDFSTDRTIFANDFFHPLIPNPVKNSINLKAEEIGVLISGSNTGGKSVYLKSVALLHHFFKFAIMIPATDARLPLFDSINYLSSDRQNLEEGLSSFSSEISDYVHLINNIDNQNEHLVIIDEIMSSTSSKEASALSLALIRYLKNFGQIKLFISTHHEELKVSIHQDHSIGMLSASVLFDDVENKPLYSVGYGAPGSSHALEIFSNIVGEQFDTLVQEAKANLGEESINYESALKLLEKKTAEVDKLLAENRQEKRLIQIEKDKIKGLITLEKEQIITEYRKKLKRVIDKAYGLHDRLKKGEQFSKRKISAEASLIKSEMENEQTQFHNPKENFETLKFEDLKIGDACFSSMLNKKMNIIGLNPKKNLVQVADKAFKIWVPDSDLSRPKGASNYNSPKDIVIKVSREKETGVTLDARGMRLDEFQNEVEFRLQSLLSKDIPYLNIIHGHGEGILKNWLRKFLKNTKDFQWDADRDHDGSTMVKLLD